MEFHLVLDDGGGYQDYFSNDCLEFVWRILTNYLEVLKWKILETIEDCVPKKECFLNGDQYSTKTLIQRLGLVAHRKMIPKDQRLRFEALGVVLGEDVVFSVFEPLLM